jgi:hypothetical protein
MNRQSEREEKYFKVNVFTRHKEEEREGVFLSQNQNQNQKHLSQCNYAPFNWIMYSLIIEVQDSTKLEKWEPTIIVMEPANQQKQTTSSFSTVTQSNTSSNSINQFSKYDFLTYSLLGAKISIRNSNLTRKDKSTNIF